MELIVRGLAKQYTDKRAVDKVSLRLTEGINGLLGANGAGKTTLMRMLCGILKPTAGTIALDGVDVTSEDYRAVLGYLPQDFGYYPGFTGWQKEDQNLLRQHEAAAGHRSGSAQRSPPAHCGRAYSWAGSQGAGAVA